MTSRERVKRSVHFQYPDRLPVNFDANRTPVDGKTYGEDMIWVFAAQRPKVNGVDEWGVVYESIGESFGEPKVFPLEGKDSLENYTFPDYGEDWRYDAARKTVEENGEQKYVLGMLPNGLFQNMIDLFGFMEFMVNTGVNPELIDEVCEQLCACAMTATKKMAECGVDGIILMDDTALQDRPMISMEAFRKIFKPRYRRLFDCAHSLGIDTFVHSCGYTLDIIEELIDAGCDAVNLDQQDNMGIGELSRRYKGRVCFYCPLDIQRTIEMTREQLQQRVDEMQKAFASPSGGFIAKTYPQPKAVGMTDSYLEWMTEAFRKTPIA